ncbi:MAG: CHRD domain-containing protein [Acidobacteria bacterium]|nr:CHRD domain-containing protein [Acidobacteriota bacterium]
MGAIRGQLTKLVEVQANTTTLSSGNEVPDHNPQRQRYGDDNRQPVMDVNTGLVTGGTVTFSVIYDIAGPPVTISGLHIHEAAAGVNGSVVISTGIGGSNTIVSATGKGTINIPVQITSTSLAPFQRMLANPTGFYVNLHTSSFPNGLIRGQLAGLASPPIIAQATT